MSSSVPVTPGIAPTPPAPPQQPTGLRRSIRRRPLTWFFALAYGLSWVAWTPYILSHNGIGAWDFTFPGGAVGSQLLGVLPGAYLGPITAALLITGVTEGRAGLRTWRTRMTKFKVGWRWYLLVVLAVPVALMLGSAALSGRAPELPSAAILVAYLPALLMQLLTTGLAEEPGWREFAMPRMQNRYGALTATAVVGVLWGIWHLPLFLTEWGGGPDVALIEPVEFIATTIAFSAVMTWVFNKSGESMPLVMLLHCGVNNYISTAWSDMFPDLGRSDASHTFLLVSAVAALILLIATRGRLGQPRPSAVTPRPALAD
ncbi:CPBP family intramembrane glutamic endopeptidase [Streptomyces shenzhenensis]|uniref:CPBP family intramembrane glutamic endopeptidase n=1 Tax=Streptomyces shenzhenensis TaxID=943815 RepID=UPI0037FCD037